MYLHVLVFEMHETLMKFCLHLKLFMKKEKKLPLLIKLNTVKNSLHTCTNGGF